MDQESKIILAELKKAPVFSHLSSQQLSKIVPFCRIIDFNPGDIIIHKDSPTTHIYILMHGKVKDSEAANIPIHTCIAEYALFSSNHYFETVHAATTVQAISINLDELSTLFEQNPTLQTHILNNLVDHSYGLEKGHFGITKNILKHLFKEMNERIKFSLFTVYTLILMSLYILSVEFITYAKKGNIFFTTYITGGVLLIFALALLIMILQMRLPLREFGFNLRNWQNNIIEALLWTFYFCVGLVVAKWWLINSFSVFQDIPMFFHKSNVASGIGPLAIAYIFFVPVQEFVIRGAIQGSLLHLLKVRGAVLLSVVVSTLIFAAVHIDFHFFYSMLVIPPGLMWSFMYARQRSLLGVTISHALIGVFAFWVLGYEQFIVVLDEIYSEVIHA